MSELPARYDEIESANDRSWYLNGFDRHHDVFLSIESIGKVRPYPYGSNHDSDTNRLTIDGNMSPLYGPSSQDDAEKKAKAQLNMVNFLESISIRPNAVKILKPQRDYSRPLQTYNVDNYELPDDLKVPHQVETKADFIFSHDPNTVLGIRPADCPVVMASAMTKNGPIMMLTHLAWEGAANGFTEQMVKYYSDLEVDMQTLQVYITPGGHAENFTYKDSDENPLDMYDGVSKLFIDVRSKQNDDGKIAYDYKIDTPNFVYNELVRLGINKTSIYLDTSDTARLDSGCSSHTRAVKLGENEVETRDLMVMQLNKAFKGLAKE